MEGKIVLCVIFILSNLCINSCTNDERHNKMKQIKTVDWQAKQAQNDRRRKLYLQDSHTVIVDTQVHCLSNRSEERRVDNVLG